MSLTDIKTKNQGFTIVELLIVVVVIAVLAAITIVSYNGITNRANGSAAKSIAATYQKKAELYNSETGRYPVNISELSADTSQSYYVTNANLTALQAAPDATTGKSRVQVRSCGNATPAAGNVTGVRITYWDYTATTPAPVDINVGTCSTVGTVVNAWVGP